jgi:hypothetical protein
MALFFYRAWAGVTANNRQLTPADPIYYTRQALHGTKLNTYGPKAFDVFLVYIRISTFE